MNERLRQRRFPRRWLTGLRPRRLRRTSDTSRRGISGGSSTTSRWRGSIRTERRSWTPALDDKSAVVAAIKATDLNSVVGPISWAKGPVPNVTKTPLVGGQWGRGKDFRFDMVIVSNRAAPNIPASGKLRPIGQA